MHYNAVQCALSGRYIQKRSIPGRHYSTFDVMLNIAGVVLGWLISHHRAGSAGTGSANCHGADHLTPDV